MFRVLRCLGCLGYGVPGFEGVGCVQIQDVGLAKLSDVGVFRC